MNLDFFPGKGTRLECIKGGTNGDGCRIHVGQVYSVTHVFTRDSDDGEHGSLKVNGESGDVTVLVAGESINPAGYPFRWDLAEHFRKADPEYLLATPANMRALAQKHDPQAMGCARYPSALGKLNAVCPETGETYSADAGDYWNRPDDEPLRGPNEEPCVLMFKSTRLVPATL